MLKVLFAIVILFFVWMLFLTVKEALIIFGCIKPPKNF